MNLALSNRTALVVGASKGIGLEVVRELRAEGCLVITASRSEGIDLMPQGAPEAFCATLAGREPDIIVHVIGGSQGLTGTLLPSDDYAKVWRLNLGISHDINRVFIPVMQRNKWGRIVHLTSTTPELRLAYSPYVSAKAALDGYVRSVSREFSKDGVIITAISLGIIHTEGRYYANMGAKERAEFMARHIPTQRFGQAEEVARVVAFLASEHSAYMAGSIVNMDGGMR